MKSEIRFYAFLCALVLLFTNYFTLTFLYSSNLEIISALKPVIGVHTSIWLIFFLILLKMKTEKWWMKFLLFPLMTLLVIILIIGVDRMVGRYLNDPESDLFSGFIFLPNSTAAYKTLEFEFEAKINALGLRDKEYSIEKKDKFRIIVVGDSFTFGWGVSAENNFENLLETRLLERGYPVEIINFGQPGNFTYHYKRLLKRAIPLLKPDLVIVGLLQGNDLGQLIAQKQKKAHQGKFAATAIAFFKASFKNIIGMMAHKNSTGSGKSLDVKEKWKSSVRLLEASLTEEQQKRYALYDPALRQLFRQGEIDPVLMRAGLLSPDFFVNVNRPELPEVQAASETLKEDLKIIKMSCDQNNSALLIINIPCAPYCSPESVHYERMGIQQSESLILDNKIDSIYHLAADHINTPILHFTQLYQKASKDSLLFFPYDSHFNESGHALLADSLFHYFSNNEDLLSN